MPVICFWNNRRLRDGLLVAGVFVCWSTNSVWINAAELQKVNQVMAIEASGKQIDRREALANESDANAQWQSGRILVSGHWLDMEQLKDHALVSQAVEYLKMRDAKELDVEGNRKMALWCQSHHLQDMAIVHWKALVAISVDDAQARKALGHKHIGNRWFSKEELEQAAQDFQKEKSCLKDWMPKVRKLVSKLKSADTKTKLEGMKDLESIRDEGAVAALKYGVMQLEPTTALPLITKIKSIRCKTACLALCEIALVDANSEVGRSAIEGLNDYDQRFYVPELLQTLQLPVSLTQQTFYMPNGALVIHRAYLKESMSEKEQAEVLKVAALFETNLMVHGMNDLGMDGDTAMKFQEMFPGGIKFSVLNSQARSSIEKLSMINNQQEARRTELWNTIQQKRETNSKQILSQMSGLPADASSEDYWNWWPAFNDAATTYSAKPSVTTYAIDDSDYLRIPVGGILRFHSCLVAGTPVQSSTGLKSVEQFKIGDSVASLNVETGEISLCPVTYVSERTADSTYAIKIKDGEVIRATGGHSWWAVGEGWTRSRDLKAGQFMRTGDSSVEIAKVERIDGPIKVYNLIVDQTHTYFAGKDRLLSWDVTSLQPTLQKFPGQNHSKYLSATR